MNASRTLAIAVVGAGPVGLALALHAARCLPGAAITVFDARADAGPDGGSAAAKDPRTLALSLGSLQLLERLRAWPAGAAEAIREVHVSQQPPTLPPGLQRWLGAPEVLLRAQDEGVPMLGAVLAYGALVAPLEAAWRAEAAASPERLRSRFGTRVQALKDVQGGVEVDAGIAENFDLAVLAEGGVYAEQIARDSAAGADAPGPWRHDYGQTAWVGQAVFESLPGGRAFERFTRHGPLALLPLPPAPERPAAGPRAAIVWCVSTEGDPVRELDDAQRMAVLNTQLPPGVGRIVELTPLKAFALGLSAERRLVSRAGAARGRVVRIGNAAQTLHPVAGQGLNLGLRDAAALVEALRCAPDLDDALARVDRMRAPDRLGTVLTTDFLARSFTWPWPGLGAARGLALAALQSAPPLKHLLARQMMFGRR